MPLSAEVPRLGTAVLFCPGDRPDRYDKAAAAADAVILDLEDAVPPERKDLARRHVLDALDRLDPARTLVRINPPRTAEGRADLAALAGSPVRYLMLPKAEAPEEILDLRPHQVVAICESATGVLRARDLAATSGCVALTWGGEDLTADLGGRRSRDSAGAHLPHVVHARASVLLAAGAAGISAWDGVYLDIPDHDGLARETEEAAAMGFAAKMAIHPTQAPVIRRGFAPTPEQVAWAAELLEAHRLTGDAVLTFRGQMVDGPLILQAEAILAAARPSAGAEQSGSSR